MVYVILIGGLLAGVPIAIAIVGDGALTSGSSYEALNNIAHLTPRNLITVINDNGMSISENIGFLTHWRQRILSHPEYHRF